VPEFAQHVLDSIPSTAKKEGIMKQKTPSLEMEIYGRWSWTVLGLGTEDEDAGMDRAWDDPVGPTV
jgi:hypothetical protein